MNPHFEKIVSEAETWMPFLEKLEAVFQEVDREYHQAAARCGFQCRGCEDSCCLTRFYHHTLLEFLYIYEGLHTLTPEKKAQVVKRAFHVRRAYSARDKSGGPIRILCPLNENSRCMLYDYRPMICRMHGIPHKLSHPVRGVVEGPGCHLFSECSQGKEDFRFDRTPFYTSIARLENELRESMRMGKKIRLTVAEMVAIIGEKGES